MPFEARDFGSQEDKIELVQTLLQSLFEIKDIEPEISILATSKFFMELTLIAVAYLNNQTPDEASSDYLVYRNTRLSQLKELLDTISGNEEEPMKMIHNRLLATELLISTFTKEIGEIDKDLDDPNKARALDDILNDLNIEPHSGNDPFKGLLDWADDDEKEN